LVYLMTLFVGWYDIKWYNDYEWVGKYMAGSSHGIF